MKPSSDLRRLWYRIKLDPYIGPMVASAAILMALTPWVGSMVGYAAVLLWAALWAVWEVLMAKGRLRNWSRRLTPNFVAVRDLAGCWRISQRPAPPGTCKEILRELLADQRRLPEALEPGMYRTLTHDTILHRLRQMDNVEILACKPAYVATLEATLSGAVRGRCSYCRPLSLPGAAPTPTILPYLPVEIYYTGSRERGSKERR